MSPTQWPTTIQSAFTPVTRRDREVRLAVLSRGGEVVQLEDSARELLDRVGGVDSLLRSMSRRDRLGLREAFVGALKGRSSVLKVSTGDLGLVVCVQPFGDGASVAVLPRLSSWEGALIQEVDQMCAVLDGSGRVRAVTTAMLEGLKATRRDVLGRRFSRFLQSPATASSIAFIVKEKGLWEGEANVRRLDGAVVPMRIRVRSTGELHHPMGSYCVTLETANREASCGWEASHDPVTALPTRPVLLDMLKEEGLTPDSPPLAILLVDLDRFRDVNVLLGHDGGDRVLMLALRRIREALGPVGGIFRLDGNTFCAVIRCGDPEATMAGDQLVEVFKAPITETQPVITVGCSVGISVAPQDGTRGDELLDKAFHALRRAKELGGGRCVRFDRQIRREFNMRMVLENGMRRAIREGQFELYYQPLVNPLSCRVVAMEALLRWPTGKGTYVPPSKFIPIAEATGLILEMGEWVLNRACTDAKRWSQGPIGQVPVSVNLSGTELRLGNPEEKIRRALDKSGLDPSMLIVEISENALLEERRRAERVFCDLRKTGVRVYIDDFGTGYSSLSYLRDFTLDGLKVDKAFVSGVPRNEKDLALISAILGMAKALCLDTVVEGVETQEQYSAMSDMGIDCIQGFLFSPPRPLEHIEAMVNSRGILLPPAAPRGNNKA